MAMRELLGHLLQSVVRSVVLVRRAGQTCCDVSSTIRGEALDGHRCSRCERGKAGVPSFEQREVDEDGIKRT